MAKPARIETSVGVIAGELAFRADWRAHPHVHPHYEELLVITQGQIQVHSRGKTWLAPEGSAVLYPRSVEHAEAAALGKSVRMICLHWESPPPARPEIIVAPDTVGRIQTAARWILEWQHRGHAESSVATSLLMESILLELRCPTSLPENVHVERAKACMRRHLAEPLTLEFISKVAGLSRCHFCTRFIEATGVPVMRYLRNLRLRAAENLILTTTLPFRAIAERVGLRDEFHFSRVFRRERGFSPSELQKHRRSLPPSR